MLSVFPFQYEKQWDGIRMDSLPIFRSELECKCINMSLKEFQKWLVNDATLFHLTQMIHPQDFKLLQDEPRLKSTPAFRRKWIEGRDFDPKKIFSYLFGMMPIILDHFSDYLFSEHRHKKMEMDCRHIYLKYRLPIVFRNHKVNVYTYTEGTIRSKSKHINRTLSFQYRDWYSENDTTVTFDMNKPDLKHLSIPKAIGMAMLCLGDIFPFELSHLCALYVNI